MYKRKESWKFIPNTNGKKVSNLGNIVDCLGVPLKVYEDSEGYKRTRINGDWKRIHRLVAETFLENPQNKPYVNHKNGNKADNRATNLEWCTPRENSLLALKNNQLNYGISKTPIVAIHKVTKIKRNFKSQAEAAKLLGIHNSEINKVLHKKRKTAHGYEFYYQSDYEGSI